jgi:periplasmic nitrate reductase NapD
MTGAPGELHVASLVVRCRPERIAPIKRAITALPGAEIPAENAVGKLVVTLEAAGEQAIRHQLEAIAALPGVLAATLVFHHAEPVAPEPEGAPPCSSRVATI